jgi:hypothetical protein
MTDSRHQDPLQYNVPAANGGFLCPCCGWGGSFEVEAYSLHGSIIGRGICSCCYWEPGFDDDPMASATALPTIRESLLFYRRAWVASGYVWKGEVTIDKQKNWHVPEQLAALLRHAPHLA